MVPYTDSATAGYRPVRVSSGCASTATIPLDDDCPAFCITVAPYTDSEPPFVGEEDGNRVVTKGPSPAKVLRKFNTTKGYKARKEFWR